MTHRVKRPKLTPEYGTTGAVCLQFGVSADYLKAQRISGELRRNIHYVNLPGSPKILWRLDLLRDWFANGGNSVAHQRSIERYISSISSSQSV